jgi:hypothetical protein
MYHFQYHITALSPKILSIDGYVFIITGYSILIPLAAYLVSDSAFPGLSSIHYTFSQLSHISINTMYVFSTMYWH